MQKKEINIKSYIQIQDICLIGPGSQKNTETS